MLKPLDRADFDCALDLLCEGMKGRDRAFWAAALDRIARAPGNGEADWPIGFLLIAEGAPQGILLTPASLRRDPDRRIVNLSSWHVRPGFRHRALPMLEAVIGWGEAVFTDLTPSPVVARILPMFGFRPINRGVLIAQLLPSALLPARGAIVRALRPDMPLPPGGPSRALVDAHRGWGGMPALLEQDGESALILFRRVRWKGMPAAELAYAPSHARLAAGFGAVARFLLGRGMVALIRDSRDPSDRGGRLRPWNIRFARGDAFTDRTDTLGSELFLLGLQGGRQS